MESDEVLNEKYMENTVTHVNLEILLREHMLAHPDSLERFKKIFILFYLFILLRIRELSSTMFSSTISRFFSLTRLLTFTQY